MEKSPEAEERWALTKFEEEAFTFYWEIQNAPQIINNLPVRRAFVGGPSSRHTWSMKIKKNEEDPETLGIFLCFLQFGGGYSKSNEALNARFELDVLTSTGSKLRFGGDGKYLPFSVGKEWGYSKLFPVKKLSCDSTQHHPHYVSSDGTLKIIVQIWIQGKVIQSFRPRKFEDEMKQRSCQLVIEDMNALLSSCVFSDVTVSTASGGVFEVHKCILGARSPVFAAMFQTNMTESSEHKVEIPDFECDIVKGMLDYIYTGQTQLLNNRALELIQIADKYQLLGLKQNCEKILLTDLTVANAMEVLTISYLHCKDSIMLDVIEFIKRNKDEVRKSDEYQRVATSHPAVATELLMHL